jgi:hypothetical protein
VRVPGDALDGDFRYHSIEPLFLAPGSTYVLAALSGGSADGWAYEIAGRRLQGLAVDPAITIASDAARYSYQCDDILRDPTDHFRSTL